MSDDFSANPPCPPNTPSEMASLDHIKAMTKACQSRIEVKLPTGLLCPVTQNLMFFAEPGARKTSFSSLLYKPFQERNGKDGKL